MNVMRTPKIVKVVLSAGDSGKELDKAVKLLKLVSEKNPQIVKSGPRRRIPAFGVKPNMPLGTSVTVRGKESVKLLKKLLGAIDNQLKKKQISENTFSFGIQEYIEIPGIEYEREIGIKGFNVTVSFERAGFRVARKKIKSGKIGKNQRIPKEEIIKFMEDEFKTQFE
jgi:large subunit ribosomal protein L5